MKESMWTVKLWPWNASVMYNVSCTLLITSTNPITAWITIEKYCKLMSSLLIFYKLIHWWKMLINKIFNSVHSLCLCCVFAGLLVPSVFYWRATFFKAVSLSSCNVAKISESLTIDAIQQTGHHHLKLWPWSFLLSSWFFKNIFRQHQNSKAANPVAMCFVTQRH